MADFYRDTEDRYRRDAEFRIAVESLVHLATQNGFTPGELKQIAFMAALRCEMFSNKSWISSTLVSEDDLRKSLGAPRKEG